MRKILVIEDEQSIRRLLLRMLKAEGFQTIEAENGRIGVQLVLSECPDLILCDIMMPDLDGYGVLATLQQNPDTAMIPFICLTAQQERSALRQVMELGANDYLTKPFTKAELLGAIAAQLDKKERFKQQQTQAIHLAIAKLNDLVYYDSLTNLPNRLLLRERFDRTLSPTVWATHSVSIAVFSLDQFERFNQSLGTDYSDLLLQAASDRLIPHIGDGGTVARLNSDQLALILPPVQNAHEAAQIAQTILDILSQPFVLQEYKIFITCSIGIAIYPDHGTELDSLLKNANTAWVRAKQLGGNRYHFYTAAIQEKSYDRLMLEMSLHRAIEKEEFQVYYQPQVNLQTGQIVGAEALIRWQHPERGQISPADFIPIAEETGLVIMIDEWVLRTACQQARDWQKAGFFLSVAVNLSAMQFNQPNLSQRVFQILSATGLDPSGLELELTESALVQNPEMAIATLTQLNSFGIQLSLDDFGTGYSSLTYLQQFPFDSLKIDRSFVCNLTRDSKNATIVTAIIQLAHSLNLKVIAEGVETEAEQAFLRQQQCDLMQGYYFSPAVTAAAFEKMLSR